MKYKNMNRMKKHQIATAMKDFALEYPPTDIYRKLEAPFLFPKNRLGTHMEYMWRLILEGNDIIQRGDSLVKNLQFTLRDVLQAQKGVQALDRAISSPHTMTPKDINSILHLPVRLSKILTYHLDKAQACSTEEIKARNQESKVHDDFILACKNADYLTLARLYPYADGVFEIEPDDALPKSLKGKMDLPEEWYIYQRAEAFRKCFKNATSLNPAAVKAYCGQPETGIGDFASLALQSDQERNFSVWKDGQNLIRNLLKITGKEKQKTDFVQNLIPAGMAP